jgi:hypothetical protein
MVNINPNSLFRDRFIEELKNLLNKYVPDIYISRGSFSRQFFSSFFIIQHPSPPIVVLNPPKNGDITGKLDCHLLCLFHIPSSSITINSTSKYREDDFNDID